METPPMDAKDSDLPGRFTVATGLLDLGFRPVGAEKTDTGLTAHHWLCHRGSLVWKLHPT